MHGLKAASKRPLARLKLKNGNNRSCTLNIAAGNKDGLRG
jgi:hypothetical protein